MPRGHEDWFINKQAFGEALSDVGELAARFNVPYSFTRSGKVVYTDGFEQSLSPWQLIVGDGYGTVVRDDVISFRGAYSAKFTPGAAAPKRAILVKIVPFVLSGKMGLEAIISGEAGDDDVIISINVLQDEMYYTFAYKISLGTSTLYYHSKANTWVEFSTTGGDIGTGDTYFHLIKMVIDTDSLTYQSVRLDNKVFDLSGIETYSIESELPDTLQIQLRADDSTGGQGIVRFDDVTLTIDEP